MVDRNLLAELDIDETAIEQDLAEALGGSADAESLDRAIDQTISNFQPGTVLKGKVINVVGDGVVVDVGLKSEGIVSLHEFESRDSVAVGLEVNVLLESVESDTGLVALSKRRADRILCWQRIVEEKSVGDTITGRVSRKIKGGLLVDIGVQAFLPASQVDIRRPGDIDEFIGQEIDAMILKIDVDRHNIVISRRRLIEDRRREAKEQLLSEIEVGQLRTGQVKNIADFGAFVDLGGIDGLLHITDMSWDRINHPSDMVQVDQDLEVVILQIDPEKEKIALGLKQKLENPWERSEGKFPVGTKVKGEVVNIMNYGAFVKLEPGVEGLLHISEMSWTRRVSHPSEMLSLGEVIEVVVLEVNKDKQEISLGLKQIDVNPWTRVAEKYPPNTVVEGVVRNLANYGAFVEIEEGIDGLLHVSDMSWTKKINHPSEVLKKGETVRCVVLAVDEEKQRIALGLRQLAEDPWLRAVPDKYIPGHVVRGTVTKVTNFGVFVELEPSLEGLLHVSELADHKVENPQDEVQIGEEIDVKILRVDNEDRKIALSRKRAHLSDDADPMSPGARRQRRGGLQGPGEVASEMIDELAFIKEGRLETRKFDQFGQEIADDADADSDGGDDAATEEQPPSEPSAEAEVGEPSAGEEQPPSEPSAEAEAEEGEPSGEEQASET
jgi:small subunit ribosomal protein S1